MLRKTQCSGATIGRFFLICSIQPYCSRTISSLKLADVKIALAHKRLDLKGGTERDLYRTAEGLRDLGHEVHLFCSEYGVAAPAGVAAHRVGVVPIGRTLRMWSFALRTPSAIKRIGCDVVVNFGRMLDQDVLRCGGGTHRGFLKRLGEQGGRRRRFWQAISAYHRSLLALERRQFASARIKKIVAVSAEVKRDIMANYAVDGATIEVLYNGVDTVRFHPNKRAEALKFVRARWQIPFDAPVVLFVGSGFRRKGLDRLLPLWSSPRLAGVYLLVVGDDARMGRYRSWADSIAPGKIIFTGRQDDIENFYGATDIVALPSLQEAFGNVVLEALASGLPVLVSAQVGAAEVLTGRLASGVVERPADGDELACKLLDLLSKSGDDVLKQEARNIGVQYSWEEHFRRLDSLLRRVCGSSGTASVS
jgi:UDP-glucose:(heptosyl)LPS alpha-1,3-glucosyltransferase